MFADLTESSRKQGFALKWMLSGSWGNSMTSILIKATCEEAKAALGEEAAATHISWERLWGVLWLMQGSCFVLCSDRMAKWSCFYLAPS